MQIANKLYKTTIDSDKKVGEIRTNDTDSRCAIQRTVTVTLTDFNNNPVVNENCTITCSKGTFSNNSQSYTGQTNDNGVVTIQHFLNGSASTSASGGDVWVKHDFEDYGLLKFTCNEATLIVQTYYYSMANNSHTVAYQSGYTNYGSTDHLTVHRTNNFVELTGRWKPTAQKTASDSAVHFATIPSEFAPSKNIKMLQQGSARATYLLTVDTAGKLSWSRYGTTSSAAFPSGGWGVVHAYWMLTGDDVVWSS